MLIPLIAQNLAGWKFVCFGIILSQYSPLVHGRSLGDHIDLWYSSGALMVFTDLRLESIHSKHA